MYDPHNNEKESMGPADGTYSFNYRQNEMKDSAQNQTGDQSDSPGQSPAGGKPAFVSSEQYYGQQNYSKTTEPPVQYAPYQTYAPHAQTAPNRQAGGKRKHFWLKVVVLVLCVAIVGTAAGMISYYSLHGFGKDSAPSVRSDVPQSENSDTDINTDGPNTVVSGKKLTTYTGPGEALTPTEVYNNYVSACVGISTEITGRNVFGQLTTTPVTGSGFIISPDGYIITNAHVVDKGTSFEVALFDGSSYGATLIGKDKTGDVALLKIDVDKELNYVVLGDINNSQVGEEVCVIGNPLGELTFTLTSGHISALDRSINIDGSYQNMFQIDAAINSGNSGGPVFNSRGEVIGVATAKYSSTGVEGLAFALPIDDVLHIANELSQFGYVKGRAYMGVYYYDVDAQYSYYYSVPTGVFVDSVIGGGCAEKAGITHGDIITKIGDVEVASGAQLKSEIGKYKAGDSAVMSIYRNGQTITLNVTFDEYIPTADSQQSADNEQSDAPGNYSANPFTGGFGQ